MTDSPAGMIVLNAAAWLAIHLGIAYSCALLPRHWFERQREVEGPPFKSLEEHVYEKALHIRHWKDHLPELGGLFPGGFSKRGLHGGSRSLLLRFAAETRRGELAHWLMVAPAPLFFLWNSIGSGWLMIGYALAANLPFIIIQRYNRRRLLRVASRQRT